MSFRGCLGILEKCFGRRAGSGLSYTGTRSTSEQGSTREDPAPSSRAGSGTRTRVTGAHVRGSGTRVAVVVWNVQEGKVLRTIQVGRSHSTSLFLGSDGKLLAYG